MKNLDILYSAPLASERTSCTMLRTVRVGKLGSLKLREAIRNLALIVEKNMYITGYWQSGHLVKSFLILRKVNNIQYS